MSIRDPAPTQDEVEPEPAIRRLTQLIKRSMRVAWSVPVLGISAIALERGLPSNAMGTAVLLAMMALLAAACLFLAFSGFRIRSLLSEHQAALLKGDPERVLPLLLFDPYVGRIRATGEMFDALLNGSTPEQLQALSPPLKQRLRRALLQEMGHSHRIALIRAFGRMENLDAIPALERCGRKFSSPAIRAAVEESLALLYPLAEQARTGKVLLRAGAPPTE